MKMTLTTAAIRTCRSARLGITSECRHCGGTGSVVEHGRHYGDKSITATCMDCFNPSADRAAVAATRKTLEDARDYADRKMGEL